MCPTNYEVLSQTLQVNANMGINSVIFQGAGTIDSYGMTIDNVNLFKTALREEVSIDFTRESNEL